MSIAVTIHPSSTYQLIDDAFECQHDAGQHSEEVEAVYMGGNGEPCEYLETVQVCNDCDQTLPHDELYSEGICDYDD